MKDYITVDLETTGLAVDTSDIIEIGAWKVKNGTVVDKFCTLVRPIIYIPRTIQEMTGISMEDVKDCETIEPVILEFFDWCEDLPFLGHNLQFDFKFLMAKGKVVGVDFSLGGKRAGIDTLKLSKTLLKLPNNKLKTVADSMNITLDDKKGGYHRAAYDSYITKLVYDRFLVNNTNVLIVSTPELLVEDSNKYGEVTNNATLDFS